MCKPLRRLSECVNPVCESMKPVTERLRIKYDYSAWHRKRRRRWAQYNIVTLNASQAYNVPHILAVAVVMNPPQSSRTMIYQFNTLADNLLDIVSDGFVFDCITTKRAWHSISQQTDTPPPSHTHQPAAFKRISHSIIVIACLRYLIKSTSLCTINMSSQDHLPEVEEKKKVKCVLREMC